MALIETKNASLDTLSVTIRALHVSGKQMTLAVFRQLPVVDPYAMDGKPYAGSELWGLVNYTIKDEGHVWLVLSCAGNLYRANIHARHFDESECEDEIEYLESRLVKFAEDRQTLLSWDQEMEAFNQEWAKREDQKNKWLHEPRRPDLHFNYIHSLKGDELYSHIASEEASTRRKLVRAKINLARAFNECDSYNEFIELPQLFIAV